MSKPFRYETGQGVNLSVTVVDARDQSNLVVNIGGRHVALSHVELDAADTRPAALRPLTDEEADRARMELEAREAEDAAAAADLAAREAAEAEETRKADEAAAALQAAESKAKADAAAAAQV